MPDTPASDTGIPRRDFLKTVGAAAGAASAAGLGGPRPARAQGGGAPIKFGLLEDRSGNFAIFGLNKWHGTQLAIKEINEGKT
ncbi:MAG TPA: twin-arginine translocation signal domain-containing protein, partial [Thermodesulfobacteriota bacterium]